VAIPETTLDSLNLYVEHGYSPGDFLEAVLSNDLFQAFYFADEEYFAAMRDIVCYIHNNVPSACYGSEEKMHLWMSHSGLQKFNK
jgi:hypothetical protein